MKFSIVIPSAQLAEFCRKNQIKKLAFFGSILRADFKAASDIDILVEFEPGHHVGYLKLAGLEQELSQMLRRKVDLRTPSELSRYFRDAVLAEADIQYEAA